MRGATRAALLTAALAAPGVAQTSPDAGRAGGEEGPPPAARPLPDDAVSRVGLLLTEGGRLDWAPRGDRIAYDRADDDGYRRIWVAAPDGSGGRCVTCGPIEFRRRHAGNPTWHPSGRYLVFQLEKPFARGGRPVPFMSVPGRNLGDDLWAVTADGSRYWRLTSHAERGSGRVLSPRFSHEGDRLAWSERVASGGGRWGTWVARVARVEEKRGGPRLEGARTVKPGRGHAFVETYGFSADDRRVLLAADWRESGETGGTDLFLVGIEDGEVERLTETPEQWDRFARLAPNGRVLVWASGRELAGTPPRVAREDPSGRVPLDLWMMSLGAGMPRRLTRFNDVFSSDYSGRVMAASAAWSREGDRLLVYAEPVDSEEAGGLFEIELTEPFGR